ncbi:hypothetical protein, partial [Pseudomonas sp. GW460-13]|uniref:hypothetical protein n=1 Tax=Pseudomonas sp. GW460-13 TaxID=2070590 RepID=UPI001C43D9EB
ACGAGAEAAAGGGAASWLAGVDLAVAAGFAESDRPGATRIESRSRQNLANMLSRHRTESQASRRLRHAAMSESWILPLRSILCCSA